MSDVLSDGQDVVVSSFKEGAYNLDAFERLRTSQPRLDFEFNAFHDILFSSIRQYFAKTEANGATITHSNTTKSYTLASGTTSGALAVAQQRFYNKYQPARSQVVFLTFLLGSGVANTRKRIGYFDSLDGIYLEQDGTTASINLRNSVTGTTTTIPQSSWEVEAQAIDFTKTQILVIDFQWLGVGRVRVGFEIDGRFILATQINNSNVNTNLYILSGSLPVRYEIQNTAASAGSSFQFYCGSVISEGGNDFSDTFGTIFSAETATAGKSIGTTRVPLLAIRPKATFLSTTNYTRIIPSLVSYFSETRDSEYTLYYAPTLTNASWVSANAESAVEYDISATAFTGGRQIATFFSDSAESGLNTIPQIEILSVDIASVQPVFLIASRTLANNSATRASISWKEIYR